MAVAAEGALATHHPSSMVMLAAVHRSVEVLLRPAVQVASGATEVLELAALAVPVPGVIRITPAAMAGTGFLATLAVAVGAVPELPVMGEMPVALTPELERQAVAEVADKAPATVRLLYPETEVATTAAVVAVAAEVSVAVSVLAVAVAVALT